MSNSSESIVIPPSNIKAIELELVGSSLILNRISEDSIEKIKRKQEKKADVPQEARDPQQEFEDARYKLPNGKDGIPAVCFKHAAITACNPLPGVAMTVMRPLFHVFGTNPEFPDMVEIKTKKVKMRTDMVGLPGSRIKIPRYRPEYTPWKVQIRVQYDASALSTEQIVNLMNRAGTGGVGEWRPQKSGGAFGMFTVSSARGKRK